ncbi:DUF3995 domain-containing protein [Paenibacillus elgii]
MIAIIVISALLLISISGLHVYWAFGGTWGSSVAIPETKARQPAFVPGKAGTLAVAVLLVVASVLLLIEAGLVKALSGFFVVTLGCWVCAIVFGLRAIGDFRYVGLTKRLRGTRFATLDSYLFTPLCLWLCFAFLLAIQIGG